MKNNGVKNLKVLGASLCLSAVLLTGCTHDNSNTITLGTKNNRYKVTYEDGTINAMIPLSKIRDSISILELKSGDKIDYKLVGRCVGNSGILYYDLKNGKKISFSDYVILVDEQSIIPHLESTDNMWLLCDVNGLITFFDETVLPSLENRGSERVYEKEN